MDNITFIIRKDGSRELLYEGSLYSDHLLVFKTVLAERPKDVCGVEVWRSQRGKVKSKSFKAARNGKELSEVINDLELNGRSTKQVATVDFAQEAAKEAAAKEAPVKEAAAKEASAKEAPAKEAAAKEAPAKEAPVKESEELPKASK